MKKSILFLLLIFCVASLQAQSTDDEQNAVQQTVIKVFDALSNKDSVALKDQCTNDVKFYEYGATWTIDSMIERAIVRNTAADFKRINKINFVNTTVSGNTAWTTYDLYSDITSNGKKVSIHWMETQVLLKEDKQWKIKLLHSTMIKRN